MANENKVEQVTDSILNSVKKLLGLEPEDKTFDADIIMNINSGLLVLYQIGIGTKTPFMITGADELYSDFVGDDAETAMVKMYLFHKTKVNFDSESTSSVIIENHKKEADELLWRLQTYEEHKTSFK